MDTSKNKTTDEKVHGNAPNADSAEIENNLVFLNGVLGKATEVILHFDIQTNILIGISTAISAFAVTNIKNNGVVFSMLAIFSIISVVFGLYAVHPPKFLRKKGQRESLLYNKKISDFKNSTEYANELKKIIDDKDSLIDEYSNEIYNIYKYHYRPKRSLFKISRNFLIIGILFSILAAMI
jgi:hypothetical protein